MPRPQTLSCVHCVSSVCVRRRVNTANLQGWQARNGKFEDQLEYEIVGQFQENDEDELANHGVAWVDMEAMVKAFEDPEDLEEMLDEFDESMLHLREAEWAALGLV